MPWRNLRVPVGKLEGTYCGANLGWGRAEEGRKEKKEKKACFTVPRGARARLNAMGKVKFKNAPASVTLSTGSSRPATRRHLSPPQRAGFDDHADVTRWRVVY